MKYTRRESFGKTDLHVFRSGISAEPQDKRARLKIRFYMTHKKELRKGTVFSLDMIVSEIIRKK